METWSRSRSEAPGGRPTADMATWQRVWDICVGGEGAGRVGGSRPLIALRWVPQDGGRVGRAGGAKGDDVHLSYQRDMPY